MSGGPGG